MQPRSSGLGIAELAGFGLLGLILGGLYALAVLRWAPSPARAFGVGLIAAAVVYPAFALFGSAGWPWIGVELLGVVVFGALALPTLATGRVPMAVAAGWALHPLWDVLLHAGAVGTFAGAPGVGHVPSWYPPACATFDWVVAVAAGRVAYSRRP